MREDKLVSQTKETAKKLFGKGIKLDPPYLLWKQFDRDLANDFSKFITGNLYSRTVLTLSERQMVTCAMLAALGSGGCGNWQLGSQLIGISSTSSSRQSRWITIAPAPSQASTPTRRRALVEALIRQDLSISEAATRYNLPAKKVQKWHDDARKAMMSSLR